MAGSSVLRTIYGAFCLLSAVPMVVRAADVDIIGVETGASTGITVRLAEDLAGLVDDGTTRRLVPMVGHGGLRALGDLLDGHGTDMAFLQLDVLDYARAQKLFPGLETRVSYVARLNYVEFHLLARAEFTSPADLVGQTVSVGPRSGDTFVTASRLFGLLKVAPILSNEDHDAAIGRLRRGEIAAVAFVGGKPAPLLRLADTSGLHLMSIPLTPDVAAVYVPSRLNATDYPDLIGRDDQVDTIAVPTGLFVGPVAGGADDYRKLANAVGTIFTQFQTLLTPGHHPKWAEVNLATQIPGWQRFPPAEDWLKRNVAVASEQDLRMIFLRFLEEREKSGGGQQMSTQQKDALFDQFRRWQGGQSN